MPIQFITLTRMTRGNEPDTSSLQVYSDRLQVIGNLPHAASIKPHTRKDAQRLLDWLLTKYAGLVVSISDENKYALVREIKE